MSKGSGLTKDQLKKVMDYYQDIWGHELAIIKSEQKYALAEDQDFFKIQRMAIRTDQLIQIMEATDYKLLQWEPEAETDGRAKKLVRLLRQYHAWFYHFSKGSTRAL